MLLARPFLEVFARAKPLLGLPLCKGGSREAVASGYRPDILDKRTCSLIQGSVQEGQLSPATASPGNQLSPRGDGSADSCPGRSPGTLRSGAAPRLPSKVGTGSREGGGRPPAPWDAGQGRRCQEPGRRGARAVGLEVTRGRDPSLLLSHPP
jgi:hypothetical protein